MQFGGHHKFRPRPQPTYVFTVVLTPPLLPVCLAQRIDGSASDTLGVFLSNSTRSLPTIPSSWLLNRDPPESGLPFCNANPSTPHPYLKLLGYVLLYSEQNYSFRLKI